jgi:hypothetical protein
LTHRISPLCPESAYGFHVIISLNSNHFLYTKSSVLIATEAKYVFHVQLQIKAFYIITLNLMLRGAKCNNIVLEYSNIFKSFKVGVCFLRVNH